MERYTNLIFDYGGVVGLPSANEVVAIIANSLSADTDNVGRIISENTLNMQKVHVSEEDFWRSVSRGLKVNDLESLKRVWIGAIENASKIDLEMLSLLNDLLKSYKLSLLSNTTQLYIYSPFRSILRRLFSEEIYSCEVGFRKPEKKIYDLTLAKLHVQPKECIIIDDEPENLVYPLGIGMDTILYKNLEDLKAKFRQKLILK